MSRGLRIVSILLVAAITARQATAQPYTLLIKHGYLDDPRSNRYDTLDIAIENNQIEKIEKNIAEKDAQKPSTPAA